MLELVLKIISTITLAIAVIGFLIDLILDIKNDCKQKSPQKQTVTYKYKSRFPKLYCPHCKNFRNRLQVTSDAWYGYYYCRACGSGVEETEFMFRQWLKETFEKADKEKRKKAEREARARRAKQYKNLDGNAATKSTLQKTDDPIDASSLSTVASTTNAQSVIDHYLNEQLAARIWGHAGLRDED